MKISKLVSLLVMLSLVLSLFPAHAVPTYVPRQGDYLNYHETIDLNNGIGTYAGYTEHQDIGGKETMNQVFTNQTVSASYSYTWIFTNSSGSRTSGSSAGNFAWSYTSLLYTKGTDNQEGNPPYVWFYFDNSAATGGTFTLLNTPMTVKSTDNSFHLPSENRNVKTVYAQGTSRYQRNDVYGRFLASYTWDTYFDPSTGYIVGYDWNEQDSDSLGNGFTWTEHLYVTSTSYALAPASFLSQYLGYIAAIAVVAVIILIIVLALWLRSRRNLLPKHPPAPPTYEQYSRQPPPQAPSPNIDLTPKQQPPVQQIVIKEVVKVKCTYCGALIDSTVRACPFCGAPRT